MYIVQSTDYTNSINPYEENNLKVYKKQLLINFNLLTNALNTSILTDFTWILWYQTDNKIEIVEIV